MDSPHHYYLIQLDYGDRCRERPFVAEILRLFDNDTLVGAGIFVNNNPFNLEWLLFLNFEQSSEVFETWLDRQEIKRSRVFNYFIPGLLNTMSRKGYNSVTFVDPESVDWLMPSIANPIFLFPDREVLRSIWGEKDPIVKTRVFLSHSSRDKPIVDSVFNELQKGDVSAWYDRYEIRPGDSIFDRINQGLERADLGVIFLSSNFMDPSSGWPMAEASYFFQKRMKTAKTNFIIVNIDLQHSELPPLLQSYKYLQCRTLAEASFVAKEIQKQIP